MYVDANGIYPLLCGENTGHHMYIDVAGRAKTDLTMLLTELQESLYNCPDKFGVFQAHSEKVMTNRQSPSHPSVNLADPSKLPQLTFPTRRAWKIKVTQIPCGCSESPRAPDGCLQYYR